MSPGEVTGPVPPPPATPAAPRDAFQIIEDERARIARDIHDGPAQLMANLVLKAEIVERLFGRDTEQALAELADLRSTARAALEETRRLIFDLRPMALDDLGLVAALRALLDDLAERHGTRVDFRVVGTERRLAAPVEAGLFRIVQEATTNALRHAGASRVDVILTIGPEGASAVVRDDGCGFDVPEAEDRARRTRRLGLVSMAERAALHGGRVDVVSTPGSGTEVRIHAGG